MTFNVLELLREGVFRFSEFESPDSESSVSESSVRQDARQDAHLVCHLLLCHVLQCPRESLILRHLEAVSEDSVKHFFSLIEKILSGYPVAYILQRKEFFGLDFYVDERVLIPRPETELLVEETIKICRTAFRPSNGMPSMPQITLADIGTGSGCIAVGLARSLPQAKIFAMDISADALSVARKNIEQYKFSDRIMLLQNDLLEEFLSGKFYQTRLDIIVANLPYIGEETNRFISSDVERSEPRIALFGGSDGLRLYERLFEQILSLKYSPRFILGEFGFAQGEGLRRLLRRFFPSGSFRIFSDLAGIERVFVVDLSVFC